MGLGHSVVLQVRRVPGDVPSSIALDHGDVLVMDGLAQSEYEHCTASELQGPRVNLTYRWVAQHTASCPLAGIVGCVLPTCAQGLVEPGFRWLGEGENKWSSSWGLVLLLLILVTALLVGTLINIRRWHRHSDQRPSRSAVHFSFRGRARWVGRRRWPLSRRRQSCGKVFLFPFCLFLVEKTLLFFQGMVLFTYALVSMLVAKWEPTPCYRDADKERLVKPLPLIKDGDLVALVQCMIRTRGRETVWVTLVEGHADDVDVQQGRVRLVDQQGNAEADA